jgi:hypothetical protein
MGRMDGYMQMVAVCQEFGWTYQEYISQPAFFLYLIREKIMRDNKAQEMQLKQKRRG